MRLPDFHVHTHFSPDSSMNPSEAVTAAIKAGVTDLCFTEHMDLGHHMESFNRIPDIAGILDSVHSLQEQYPAMRIRCGLEAGYIGETAVRTADVLAGQPFDYILLSTHCVDGIDCYLPEFKRGQNQSAAYRRYLEVVYESVACSPLADCCDCIGHLGYIAKCQHYEDNAFPYSLFPEMFDRILAAIIRRGKGVEINTSGLGRAGHVLPHPTVIRRYRELGGRILTVGSDAHRPGEVGASIRTAIKTAADCGFDSIAVFTRRELEFIPIR